MTFQAVSTLGFHYFRKLNQEPTLKSQLFQNSAKKVIILCSVAWWISVIKEPHDADWGKYGQDAIRVSNDEMTTYADALIAFWDGQSLGIKNMIDLAKQKNIKVAVVKY